MLNLLLLLLSLGVLWWFVRNDASEYATFKKLTNTTDRQRFYRIWILKSFLSLFGTTLVCLYLLHRLHTFATLPAEFIPLAARLAAHMPTTQMLDKGFLIGVAIGATISGILIGVLLAKKLKTSHATLGDVEPLMPRNTAETCWTAVLSLNAGLSEECFFRLLLPLLLIDLLHKSLLAFAIATILFGLAHFYQGIAGIITTTLLGVVFVGLYLWTGSLWITMATHAALDLFALVVRPTIMRLLHRPTA